jgi:hypothetical protein
MVLPQLLSLVAQGFRFAVQPFDVLLDRINLFDDCLGFDLVPPRQRVLFFLKQLRDFQG